MAEETKTENRQAQSKTWLVGAAAVIFAAVVAGWLFFRNSAPVPAKKTAASQETIGVVDAEEALKAHSSYGKLKELRESYRSLAAELAALKEQNMKLQAPEAQKRPFDDAAEQKLHQKEITTRGELMEELKAAEKKKRQELDAAWQAERKETNDEYLNEILNIRLKLDNADMMRLSKETRLQLAERMKTLQQERGLKQRDINRKYEEQISEHIAGLAEQKGIAREEALALFYDDVKTYELRKRSEAQRRNVEEIHKNLLKSIERQQKIISLQTMLAGKEAELNVLEGKMLEDIAGKASKLAVMHHLAIILAMSSENSKVSAKEATMPAVVNVKAIDLTKELVKELRQ